MQSLNQLHKKAKNGSNSRQEEEGKHHERKITIEELVIQEVLERSIDITHLLIQQRHFIYLKIP